MSREIKFRVWAKKGGYYLDAYTPSFGFALAEHVTGSNPLTPSQIEFRENVELEQFTGLKDSQGRAIYEGDIVRLRNSYRDGPGIWHDENVIIFWDEIDLGWRAKHTDGASWCRSNRTAWTMCSREIVGNLHENQDLLKP